MAIEQVFRSTKIETSETFKTHSNIYKYNKSAR